MKTSLYIHIPFCSKKCPYCSFPVVVGQLPRGMEYVQALLSEALLYEGRKISHVYLGGGTPSVLDEAAIGVLSDGLKHNFSIDVSERTFEFNPESVLLSKAMHVRSSGFNRASLGLQSFQPKFLSYLGRGHSVPEGISAFQVLRQAGFDNISIDLMFGFPGQTMGELDADIDAALSLKSEHVSIYALTVEDKSLFAVRGVKMSDDTQAAFYNRVMARLKEAGLEQYEVSNFSRPGFASKHNMNYWQGGEYIGLGVGAHGHVDGQRYWNVDTFPSYMQRIREGGSAVAGREKLAPTAKMTECLLFGLRMNAGVDIDALEKKFKVRFDRRMLDEIGCMAREGLLIQEGSRVRTTDAGRLVLDAIAVKLL
ncbi:MAG: radical SAM family heme chaperone HemW [Candidatus Omnitrophica bacterium]|nr:radical SAM family heme chaperone HemW [Candidatus Omnitrophota bacterium]